MTFETRLVRMERRVRPEPTAPAGEPFDWDAYRARWQEASRRPPEELARECAEFLAAADWPEPATGDGIDWTGFSRGYIDAWTSCRRRSPDWPAYTSIFYRLLAGSPPNWPELLAEATGR
jgi:hypothetical protein